MEELGIVRKIFENEIYVEVTRAGACGSNCSSCNAKCAESKSEILRLNNTIDAKVGDIVKLKSDSRAVLTYIFLVYGLPLIVMIMAITISNYVFFKINIQLKDLWSMVVGLCALITTYLMIKKVDQKFSKTAGSIITLEKL
ncbi:MAG: SoxR reducing system RseC family protein [Tissierellia bacterium]|nr:SoxR reducing system RseC family protein [Tissierellia bacterium]